MLLENAERKVPDHFAAWLTTAFTESESLEKEIMESESQSGSHEGRAGNECLNFATPNAELVS